MIGECSYIIEVWRNLKGDKEMKVLVSYLFCTKGGVETALLNRLKKVDTKTCSVDLHFFHDYGGIAMFQAWSGRVYLELGSENIKRIVKENQYDIVITIDSLAMIKLLKEIDYSGKIGLEVHTTYKEGLRYLSDRLVDQADFILVPSEYQKSLVLQVIKTKNIYVLGNAISDDIWYDRQCIFNTQKRIVLWVGRVDAHKNWRLFLRIAKYLSQKEDDFIFLVVGGLKSETAEIDAFEKSLYQMDLEKTVFWIPQIDYKDMRIVYSYAANSGGCYLSTSKNESFGMTVVEAMKCRCPVVVNAVGALREIVGTAYGLCVEGMEKEENMERISAYILDKGKSSSIDKAEKYVQEKFCSDAIGKQFMDILETVSGKKRLL